jgi:hypothetical protein
VSQSSQWPDRLLFSRLSGFRSAAILRIPLPAGAQKIASRPEICIEARPKPSLKARRMNGSPSIRVNFRENTPLLQENIQ